jgi:hypothetical protein
MTMLLIYFLIFHGPNAIYSLKYVPTFLVHIFFILYIIKIYNLCSKLDLVWWLVSLISELAMRLS